MSRSRTHRLTAARMFVAVVAGLLAAAVVAAVAVARSSAAPQNTSPPTISGTTKDGQTVTAENGSWSNSPTSFAYQWQRCDTDGTGCGDITGATKQTYTLTSGDVNHTVRVTVSASNADGKSSATSDPSQVIGSNNGPTNTVKPTVSGTNTVGDQLTTTNGSWTPTPTAFRYQWQRCTATGDDCRNISGATAKSYTVRADDTGHTLRVLVTARTSGGFSTAVSNPTAAVGGPPTTTTTVTSTITTQSNRPPALSFLSLRRVGLHAVARFRVCDDNGGTIRITLRENKARALSVSRRFSVRLNAACTTYSRAWTPAARFRTHGRYAVSLRAVDSFGDLSRLAARSVVIH